MNLSTRSSVEPIDPQEVPLWMSDTITYQYFQVATVTLLVYDALLTMKKEVNALALAISYPCNYVLRQAKHFWRMPRNTVDFVYFANRYIGIFGASVYLLGNFSAWTRIVADCITIGMLDYILMIRVLALYSQDMRLSICLKTLLALEIALKFGLSLYITWTSHVTVGALAKDMMVCGHDFSPPWQLGIVDWLVPMVYGIVLFVLALYKATEYWRMSAGFKGFPLVKVVIRDQSVYFMFVIACSIFNIMQFKLRVSDNFLSNLLTFLGNPALLCVLGSRMLFNLKETAERGENQGTSLRVPSRTVSQMDFAETGIPQRFDPSSPFLSLSLILTHREFDTIDI
ncbi:hypothetical protein ACEPAH_8552 [Sanghuangporus vaninii]